MCIEREREKKRRYVNLFRARIELPYFITFLVFLIIGIVSLILTIIFSPPEYDFVVFQFQ